MKLLKIFVTILTLIGISSCAKDIIDLTCTIDGIVKDKTTGVPLSNCEILLTPTNRTITTSRDGIYSFTALDPGEYTLTFNRSGYISDTRSINIKSGETASLDMLLEAKSSFSLSEEVYDFGDLESSKTFICFNNSASDCAYALSNLPEWILTNKEQGTVKAGSNDSFTLTIDRSKVGIGTYSQNVTVTYSGHINGTTTLLVKMKKVEYTTPSVTTATSASTVSENNVTIDGTITGTGGSQITAYGHCWSTSENPTINDQHTNLGMTDKIGAFTSTIENLMANTTYYVRAYATNAQGTSYGEQTIIKTKTTSMDVWDGQIASAFAGGSGSSFSPYIIKTGGQLLLMKDYPDSYFKLENDIDLNNNNWIPINFEGHLNGNNHTIYNLKISRGSNYQGLFSELNGTVENLKINGIDIQAETSYYIGSIAGVAENATISNCEVYIDKTIIGSGYVGGIAGKEKYSSIKDCRVTSSVHGGILGNEAIGGIVGFSENTEEFLNNHASVNIEGENNLGGCIGNIYRSCDIVQCSFQGNIKGKGAIGGIIGSTGNFWRGNIIACKSDITIVASQESNSQNWIGGIAGQESSTHPEYSIMACYSNGTITSKANYGVLCPLDPNLALSSPISIEHCYSTIQKESTEWHFSTESTSIYDTENIAQTMREYYSNLSRYWNYNNTWTWTGNINGIPVSIPCPKLSWEE